MISPEELNLVYNGIEEIHTLADKVLLPDETYIIKIRHPLIFSEACRTYQINLNQAPFSTVPRDELHLQSIFTTNQVNIYLFVTTMKNAQGKYEISAARLHKLGSNVNSRFRKENYLKE